MKSKVFTIGLINQYHLLIPNDITETFAKATQNRVKVKAFFKNNVIDLYASLKKDKVNVKPELTSLLYFAKTSSEVLPIR